MQFKAITTILLFFVAQTMATPSLQTREEAAAAKSCTFSLSWFFQCIKGLN